MKELKTHLVPNDNDQLQLFATDERGPGNAHHNYDIMIKTGDHSQSICKLKFQEGGIKDKGVNGLTNEVLLAVVQDRLEGFQSGKFPCVENAAALGCVKAALFCLQTRTMDRMKRGVEGKEEK